MPWPGIYLWNEKIIGTVLRKVFKGKLFLGICESQLSPLINTLLLSLFFFCFLLTSCFSENSLLSRHIRFFQLVSLGFLQEIIIDYWKNKLVFYSKSFNQIPPVFSTINLRAVAYSVIASTNSLELCTQYTQAINIGLKTWELPLQLSPGYTISRQPFFIKIRSLYRKAYIRILYEFTNSLKKLWTCSWIL